MMEFATSLILGLCLGGLTGFFGAGGGFILTPALNLFLGMDMVMAVGTGAAEICGASTLTLAQRLDRHFTGMNVALWCAAGIFPGCWCGTLLVTRMEQYGKHTADMILLALFAVLLTSIAFSMFLEKNGKEEKEVKGKLQGVRWPPYCTSVALPNGPFSIPVLVLLGTGTGFLSGLLGIGGGVVMLPAFLYLVGQPGKFATLSSTILVFLSSIVSALLHGYHGHISYHVFAYLLCGAIPGSLLGTYLQKKSSTAATKRKFAWVVVAAAVMVIFKLVREILS